jgi:hypothetical protein
MIWAEIVLLSILHGAIVPWSMPLQVRVGDDNAKWHTVGMCLPDACKRIGDRVIFNTALAQKFTESTRICWRTVSKESS